MRASNCVPKIRVGVSALLLATGACASPDRVIEPVAATPNLTVSTSVPDVPGSRRWSSQSDSALWQAVMDRDSLFAIGLKDPGQARGVARGRPVLSRANWANGIAHFASRSGIHIVTADSTHLPVILARLDNVSILAAFRRLPFVDYVEPAKMHVMYFASHCDDGFLGSGGSSGGSSSAQTNYGGPLNPVPLPGQPGLADSIGNEFRAMQIDKAWFFSTGAGVTIGITDTGVDTDPPSEFSTGYVNTGSSSGRSFWVDNLKSRTYPFWGTVPTCAHGTHIAGLAAAPRNGRSVVGAAYASNLVEVYQADGENPDVVLAGEAIHEAVQPPMNAKVVIMAWGEYNWYDNVSNEINAHYYNDDVMFVGAAGTCPFGSLCPQMGSAVFPADKEEVLAVTGANYPDGTRPYNMFDYGTKSGILAYTNLPTTGFQTPTIVVSGGSSAATGVVGGIAALVRARYPSLNNRAVMDRLIQTAGSKCSDLYVTWRNSMVNALAAVGGQCPVITGPAQVQITSPNRSVTATYHVVATGDNSGQYTYSWTAGGGASGTTVTQTFWSNSTWTSYTDYASVTVTDPVTGFIVTRWFPVYVSLTCRPHTVC